MYFRRAIANIMEEETKKQKGIQAVKEAEEKVAQLSISYVEYLDNDTLFQKLFENDEGTFS